jgi:hypothetical protein
MRLPPVLLSASLQAERVTHAKTQHTLVSVCDQSHL